MMLQILWKIYLKVVQIVCFPLAIQDFLSKNVGKEYNVTTTNKIKLIYTFHRNCKKMPTVSHFLEHLEMARYLLSLPKQVKGTVIECGYYAGGRVIIKVPNMRNPFNLAARYIDFTHEVGFTENSLYQVLTATGFSNVEIEPKIQDSLKRLWRKPRRLIGYLVRKILVLIMKNCFEIADRAPVTGQPLNLFSKRIIAVAYKLGGE